VNGQLRRQQHLTRQPAHGAFDHDTSYHNAKPLTTPFFGRTIFRGVLISPAFFTLK